MATDRATCVNVWSCNFRAFAPEVLPKCEPNVTGVQRADANAAVVAASNNLDTARTAVLAAGNATTSLKMTFYAKNASATALPVLDPTARRLLSPCAAALNGAVLPARHNRRVVPQLTKAIGAAAFI